MDLNKYIVKNDGNRLFHSSGYAQIANGDNLGSDSNTTFNQRLEIDRNRRIVGEYKRSIIGGVMDRPRINLATRPTMKPVGRVVLKRRPMPMPAPKKRGIFF